MMKRIIAFSVLVLLFSGCTVPVESRPQSPSLTSSSGVQWYTPMPQTINEREKNRWACEQIVFMSDAFTAVLEEAYATNQEINVDRLVGDYIEGFRALSLDLDTPFGDYLAIHADGMEAEYFNPDPTGYEETAERGQALNNGERVEIDEDSLFDRCQRLGVNLVN